LDDTRGALVLSVDDDPDLRQLLAITLETAGFRVKTAADGASALAAVEQERPDIILLDYMMPGMSGMDVCAKLQEDPRTSHIPVVFLTAVSGEVERARAFALGAVDYIVKPFEREEIIETVNRHLATASRFQEFESHGAKESWPERIQPSAFMELRSFLSEELMLGPESLPALSSMTPATVLPVARRLGIPPARLAEALAKFLNIEVATAISPREVRLGVLPTPYSKSNLVVPIRNHIVGDAFVLSNPFDWDLIENLERVTPDGETFNLLIAEPDTILSVFEMALEQVRRRIEISPEDHKSPVDSIGAERQPVAFVADDIIVSAIKSGAHDVSIDPGLTRADVRLRIGGDARDLVSVGAERAAMLVSRLKALGGMDISEKRRPQRGSIEIGYGREDYDLILHTGPTQHGETIVGRLIPVGRPPRSLVELGMSASQAETARTFMSRPRGLLVIAGPAGSGKTTTAHSLLSFATDHSRSILTIEDPIEYRLAFANQQQVDAKASVTYEALMGVAQRRNPDILFIGEIEEDALILAAIEFAKSRSLVVATMRASDTLDALERIERAGVSREQMAEGVVGVVAQRLSRTPCAQCRVSEEPTQVEASQLAEYLKVLPDRLIHEIGCPQCAGTGFRGQLGVFEVTKMAGVLDGMLRTSTAWADMRTVWARRGTDSLADSVLQRVIDRELSLGEAFRTVLVEAGDSAKLARASQDVEDGALGVVGRILVVDDSEDMRDLLESVLGGAGHDVTSARNGVEALRLMSIHDYDLVVSDLNMPLMGGLDLFARTNTGQSAVPAILYSASDSDKDEIQSLRMGASDYLRMPANPEVLRLRVARALA